MEGGTQHDKDPLPFEVVDASAKPDEETMDLNQSGDASVESLDPMTRAASRVATRSAIESQLVRALPAPLPPVPSSLAPTRRQHIRRVP